ncbi:hypothetical protein [Flavobacterium sp.]|uniref:hypothetical protein n=1 Tax=Flavobacterium sp. TaxID=239 RepID=UPI0040475FB3
MEWINKRNLIESFLYDVNDYVSFRILKERMIANDEGTCFAQLINEYGYYKYLLTWHVDGKYIGDYVKVFEPTEENVKIFNEGCRILAERLEIFIATNDAAKVPINPPAFGVLTHHKK